MTTTAGDEDRAFEAALTAHRSGQLAEAIAIYESLLADRADPSIEGLLGAALTQDGRLEDGLRRLHDASTVAPGNMTILTNYGHALCVAKRFGEAEGIYARAAACDPLNEEVFSRLAALCDENGRFDAIIEAARRRLDRDPNDVEAHIALSKGYLTSGDLARGWPEFEWRWRADSYVEDRERHFNRPLWDGRPLGRRTLLVHAEMGVGDTIQMIRFVPWLTRKHPEASFILFVDPNLRELLADTFAEFPAVRVQRAETDRIAIDYDLHLPLMSLARVYGATLDDLENRCPYISVGTAQTYSDGRDLVVGIAWYTRAKEDGPRRSVPLEAFLSFCAIPGVRLIDLQYGDTEAERQRFADKGGTIHHDDSIDQLASIKAFARQVKGCDLIITIDNSTAHVAGTLGKRTWLLLHRTANWRWFKDRDDSPWYPSLRLYRQDETGTWPSVVERLTADLRILAKAPAERRRRPAPRSGPAAPVGRPGSASAAERPLLILGLPRSGTSMVAGLLSRMGLWLGRTVPGDKANPKGYFENVRLRETVNKRVLMALSCDPKGVRKLPELTALPTIPGLKQSVLDIVASESYDGAKPWGFKDAKLTLLWPLWREHFPAARWLIVKRPRKQVIDSCLATYFMHDQSADPDFWEHFCAAYEIRLEALRHVETDCWEIEADDLVQGRLAPFEALTRSLGLIWSEQIVTDFVDRRYWGARENRKA